ncbi:hypothetical protein [Tomitella gaofuii]|uniref:hypothetical protein n=1 Tax=Tomitella gaofuii TaxID=2760083 RepID=UPI0015FA07AC|nr:hypothetical protein [Tomitella gaofuii]
MGSKTLLYVMANSITAVPFIGILRAFASIDPASAALGDIDTASQTFADGSLANA